MKNEMELLFGSRARWRIIKFFLLNEHTEFSAKEINQRNKLDWKEAAPVLSQLVKAKFLISKTKGSKNIYILNNKFYFYMELKKLVIKSNTYPQCESLRKIKKLGDVKLGLISGAFINNPKSKTDLLLVADNISRVKMKHLLEDLEAELGKEINYSLMNFQEFKYRTNMFDKFICEILEDPHEIVINKIPNLFDQIKVLKSR